MINGDAGTSGLFVIEIKDHGEFEVSADRLDDMMERHLPASVSQLRAKILEVSGEGCVGHSAEDAGVPHAGIGEIVYCDGTCVTTYRNLRTVTECLVLLADMTD